MTDGSYTLFQECKQILKNQKMTDGSLTFFQECKQFLKISKMTDRLSTFYKIEIIFLQNRNYNFTK